METLTEHLKRRLERVEELLLELLQVRDAQSATPQIFAGLEVAEGAERRAREILALKRQHHEINVCITTSIRWQGGRSTSTIGMTTTWTSGCGSWSGTPPTTGQNSG